jgi:hypothetical protein
MLRNQQRAEMARPSGKPLQGPWGVPSTRWKLLDARLKDRRAVSKGTVAFQRGSDLYATYREAASDCAARMDVVPVSYELSELDETDEETLNQIDRLYTVAQVWPPLAGSASIHTSRHATHLNQA